MSNRKIYENHCTLTRGELAAELHRLASRLETGRDLDYGIDETAVEIAVPHQIHRELEIKSTSDGGMKFEIEFRWMPEERVPAVVRR